MIFKFNVTLLIVAVFCIVGIFGRSQQGPSCKLHGSPCDIDSECCNNAVCHRFSKRCQIPIDENSLQAQRDRLRHVDNKPEVRPIASTSCKQHGAPCVSDSDCCSGTVCHRYAKQCQVRIDSDMLIAQRARLRHVDNQYH